jgi:hypothetical protein
LNDLSKTPAGAGDDWSPGVKAWVLCYATVQLLGVLMGAVVTAIGKLAPSVKQLQDIDARTVRLLVDAGFGLTFIPVIVYTPILTLVVMACIRRRSPTWMSYAASVWLVIPFFIVVISLFDPAWARKTVADLDMLVLVAALFASCAAAGIAGTAVTHWSLAVSGYARHSR